MSSGESQDIISELVSCLTVERDGTYLFEVDRFGGLESRWRERALEPGAAQDFERLFSFAQFLAEEKQSPVAAADIVAHLGCFLPALVQKRERLEQSADAKKSAFSRFAGKRKTDPLPEGEKVPAARLMASQPRPFRR